jgi:hypothetical protein
VPLVLAQPLAAAIPGARFSPVVLLTLLGVLAVSYGMFWLLSQRATTRRHWVAMSDWAREAHFRLQPPDFVLPALIARLPGPDGGAPQVRLTAVSETTLILQFQTAPVRSDVAAPPAPLFPSGRNEIWQLIVRRIDSDWKPTGLRPAAASVSMIDLFSLTPFPGLGDPDRLLVCGTDSSAARAVAESFVVALLPPDIGLLLHGRQIALDFSARPFDVIEFNRMLALMDQIAAHLPVLG